ncbi:MAG: methenyltetrahydromethanopterin cyclohydrolase [Solidesulfovibrio sp. DCME]|uniref:methenyltetrahydromethanopterin cyclohydrolase n=1 Tax=Solidesulfovibrio sp. DCME TaxID=3447380 RepID=UPI003D141458
MSAITLNERSLHLVRRLIADQAGLDVAAATLPGGTVVIDAGIAVRGSLEAGRLVAEICLGGLGRVAFCDIHLEGLSLPGLRVDVSRPELACMASQYAGWAVSLKNPADASRFFAMGSGPARALYRGEAIFGGIAHTETSANAVLVLEGRQPPTEAVAAMIAKACGVASSELSLVVAPTASLVGSVQIAARVVETGMHKLHELGFPLDAVISGSGTCPVAPVAADDLAAIGRTNDAVLYGGEAWYTVSCEDAAIERVLDRVPACASRDYGTLFADLFARYEGNFYKIDPMLFSPARVSIANAKTGRLFLAGQTDPELLRRSFGL